MSTNNPIFKMFLDQPAITYLAWLSPTKTLVDSTKIISDFMAYYDSLDENEQKYLLKNTDGYDRNNWRFAIREPDEESKLFRESLKYVILTHTENGKNLELEMLYDFDPDFLNKVSNDYQVQMVKFLTTDASFSKYNPEFQALYIVRDKKNGVDKGITTKGLLFGDKEIVMEKTMPMMIKNEEEKV